MFEQVTKTDQKTNEAVNRKVAQSKQSTTAGLGFVDNRSATVKQHSIKQVADGRAHLEQISQLKPVTQLNRDLHNKIYYGKADERGAYQNQDNAPQNVHTTVDTLNDAIGLNMGTLGGALPMGAKRAGIRAAILNRDADNTLTADEKSWAAWLAPDINALLLPDMTGFQCRADMNMDDSWFQRLWAVIFTPTKHHILDHADGWKQEDHSVNLDGVDRERMKWTGQQRTCHNNYVATDNAGEPAAYDNLEQALPDPMKDQVIERTQSWLRGEVMHRFWRLTSKMGLDFFAAGPSTQVDFVRDVNATERANGRRRITDSEWEHAVAKGYVEDDGNVTRIDPV